MLDLSGKFPKISAPSQTDGHIQVIFGPMFSGKTTELVRRLRKYEIANHKCLIVRYPHDSRYSDTEICTHDKQSLRAVSVNNLFDLRGQANEYSVIGIDEGQFFQNIVPFAEEMAQDGKIVIIAALDGTYQRKGFSSILELIPLAESVIKLQSVCMVCFQEASFTQRIGKETQLEVIGGTDKYMAVCRLCYKSNSDKKPSSEKFENKCSIDVNQDKENSLVSV